MSYPIIVLKPKRTASISRKHPWIFSGAINKIILEEDQDLKEGDLVQVVDSKEKPLAVGHFSEGSIAIRILSFKVEEVDSKFWEDKIKKAYQYRKVLSLMDSGETTTYRLIHAEGDGLPGLIIDIYGKLAVVQAHSLGMAKSLSTIAEAVKITLGDAIEAVYTKSEKTIPSPSADKYPDDFLIGKLDCPQTVLENKLKFQIDWITGQKTGFFIDQRENRKLLQNYCKDKNVLNTFCYSGGFSVYAIAAGAALVHSVDSSEKAIELTDNNVAINFKKNNHHESFAQDTLEFLNETKNKYDVILLDPPAYAKSKSAMHKAVQGYKRLNDKALRVIEKGGILFTFSCSKVISRKLFEDTITAAAISANRNVRILHHLSQSADHPVNIFHPEGQYLKGLVLFVE